MGERAGRSHIPVSYDLGNLETARFLHDPMNRLDTSIRPYDLTVNEEAQANAVE